MKKILSFILIGMLSVTCACNRATVNNESSHPSAGVSKATEKKQPTNANNAANLLKAPQLRQTLSTEYKSIDAHALEYTSYLGIRKTFPHTLPVPLAYKNDKLFYMSYKVPEGMSKKEMDEAHKNKQIGPEINHFGYYDYKSKEKFEMPVKDWHMMSMNYATYILPDNRMLLVYVVNESKSKGIHSKVALLDFVQKTQTTLGEYETFNALSTIKKLNDEEVVLFLTVETNQKKDETKQIMLKYNCKENKLTEIYQGEVMSEKSKDIFAFTCTDGKIYLLMHQIQEGKLHSFLRCMDKYGKQIEEKPLNALSMYESPEQLAFDMLMDKDMLFVQFEGMAKSLGRKLPAVAILRKVGDDYQLQDTKSMQIDNIPFEPRQSATEPLLMRKTVKDDAKENYQYYAYYPEKNVYDLWDLGYKRKDGSYSALNIQNKRLFVFRQDQDNKCSYYWVTPKAAAATK